MLTEGILNRVVTTVDAAEVATVRRGTLAKLRCDGDLAAGPMDVADALNLSVASKLHALGIPLTRAVGIAGAVTREDWRRVVVESDPARFHLIAGPGADGRLMVAVADDAELAALPARPGICVDLTAVGREVFTRLAELRRGEVP